MIVYRITKAEYSDLLLSSGRPNRWNKNAEHVIYTSGSVSLCALELLAHSGGIRPAGTYRIMHIEIEKKSKIASVNIDTLPDDWPLLSGYPSTQEIGSEWYESHHTLLLKIPSAIIHQEYNYMINCKHPDFDSKVKILEITDFIWDHRFPESDLIS